MIQYLITIIPKTQKVSAVKVIGLHSKQVTIVYETDLSLEQLEEFIESHVTNKEVIEGMSLAYGEK